MFSLPSETLVSGTHRSRSRCRQCCAIITAVSRTAPAHNDARNSRCSVNFIPEPGSFRLAPLLPGATSVLRTGPVVGAKLPSRLSARNDATDPLFNRREFAPSGLSQSLRWSFIGNGNKLTYCLSLTRMLVPMRPFSWMPVLVVVNVLPSGEITMVATWTSLPPFIEPEINVFASTRV